MDYTPGLSDAFESNHVRIVFFPPNCTSWNQPCDTGLIADLKKQYKYLHLRENDLYECNEQAKNWKKAQGRKLPRNATGVFYGNRVLLLKATNYMKGAQDSDMPRSIKNASVSAKLMTLEPELDEEGKAEDVISEAEKALGTLNLSTDLLGLEECFHVDDEKTKNNELRY
ncbi:hypothetical protein D915_005655 [Fasciola hepatica]|uniref:DDE-1 domain-containing protein n=1 Tax=Fasciola hepatica TaxID=6192 RepID=A0A4E0R9H6_FASHE|nr:hypothetical protein D915_005655 [Fasciola hepatica]